MLKEQDPEFSNSTSARRNMIVAGSSRVIARALEFDLEQVIASLGAGQPAIPVWLDAIQADAGSLAKKLLQVFRLI